MATPRKRATKKSPKPDIDFEPEEEQVPLPTTIETRLIVDNIEYERDEERPEGEPICRITFHAELPEHIAQHLFAHHVQQGGIGVEFLPPNPQLRRRDMLVRR